MLVEMEVEHAKSSVISIVLSRHPIRPILLVVMHSTYSQLFSMLHA
jgi:hypothetical protein